MATILVRKATNTLLQIHINSILCHSMSAKISTNYKCLQTRFMESSAVPRTSKSTIKRVNSKQSEFISNGSWSMIAYNLSERLELKNVERLLGNFKEYKINEMPEDLQHEAVMLTLKTTKDIVSTHAKVKPLHDIFIFREGSIVFWGVPYEQQKRFLYALSPLKINPYSNDLIQEEKEHLNYALTISSEKSRLNRDIVQLTTDQDSSLLRLDQFAFSHAVVLSVKLGIWEVMLDQYINSVSWVTSSMKSGKEIQLTRDQVFRKTGELYELKHRINLSSDLLDLPDIYWDRHDQEVLFLSLISFLNIKKRTAVMNEKLNNCCELMNILAGHMNDKHHVRLEWMIIVLIMVEVLFEVSRFF